MSSYSIKDLENITGIKAHTLRIWEQRYNFLKPERTDTNIRTYSDEDLVLILNLALLNQNGYKVSVLDKMPAAEINELVLKLTDDKLAKGDVVHKMIHSILQLDSTLFETILSKEIAANGIEHTIPNIIFPLLAKVGYLWRTSHILPMQEHAISSIIRQKIIAGTDALPHVAKSEESTILFLPQNEHHELGIIILHYLLKKQNVDVLYLGANVPYEDLEKIVRERKPRYLQTHITKGSATFCAVNFLSEISRISNGSTVVLSGDAVEERDIKAKNIVFISNYNEMNAFISKLKT